MKCSKKTEIPSKMAVDSEESKMDNLSSPSTDSDPNRSHSEILTKEVIFSFIPNSSLLSTFRESQHSLRLIKYVCILKCARLYSERMYS